MDRAQEGGFKRGNTNIYRVIFASAKNIHASEISGFILRKPVFDCNNRFFNNLLRNFCINIT